MSSLGVFPYRVATASMMPTVQKDDFLMTDPEAYDDQAPQRGDLIVFEFPQDRTKKFLMRVIAVEGERVEIKEKQIYIDGEPLQESYKVQQDIATENIRDNFGPTRIPSGHCFVLGDNRDNSYDGRYWGALPLANVEGKALYIYWSKDKKKIGPIPKSTAKTSEP